MNAAPNDTIFPQPMDFFTLVRAIASLALPDEDSNFDSLAPAVLADLIKNARSVITDSLPYLHVEELQEIARATSTRSELRSAVLREVERRNRQGDK